MGNRESLKLNPYRPLISYKDAKNTVEKAWPLLIVSGITEEELAEEWNQQLYTYIVKYCSVTYRMTEVETETNL